MITTDQPRPEDQRAIKAVAALRKLGARDTANKLMGHVGSDNVMALHKATIQAECWLELKAAALANADDE